MSPLLMTSGSIKLDDLVSGWQSDEFGRLAGRREKVVNIFMEHLIN
jgi:hypothetical protein